MCVFTYNYVCVHACECYVCLSVHIYVYTIYYVVCLGVCLLNMCP